MSSVSRLDSVAYVSSIQLDMRIEPDTKIDAAEFFSGISLNHAEVVSGNFVDKMRCETDELQCQFPVLEGPGSKVVLVRLRHAILARDRPQSINPLSPIMNR